MEALLIFSTFLLALGTLGLMLGPNMLQLLRPFRFVGLAFLLLGVSSLAFCADLTTTAGVIMGLDFRHPSVQTIAIALLALGGLTIAGLFAGHPLEAFLEHAVMDKAGDRPWLKTILPGVFAFGAFYIDAIATGLPWQAAFLPALVAWSKSLSVHASDSGSQSAQAVKEAAAQPAGTGTNGGQG